MTSEMDHEANLRMLEEGLLDPAVRGSREQLDALLHDDFVEFGSSGRTYDKAAILDALTAEPGFDDSRSITDFRVSRLAPSVSLVTYSVPESNTLRSSIWQSDGKAWRMIFHQGTRRVSGVTP